MSNRGFWKTFTRAQLASIAATAVDFGLLVLLVEQIGLWYVAATALGAACGAVTNFLFNRYWSFEAAAVRWERQALRYGLVSGGSLLLNVGVDNALTEGLGSPYGASKLVTALAVGWLFNYPLHRGFVFSPPSSISQPSSQ